MGEVENINRGFDYSTPMWAIQELAYKEKFTGTIWEPACGKGNISEVFKKKGFEVYSTDLFSYGYGLPDVDFLNNNCLFGEYHQKHDNIITNPPANVAMDFIKMAKLYSNHKIAFLLKTTFLEGVDRREMFKDTVFPLKKIYQFVRRLTFYEDREEKGNKNGGMMSFAWYIWERGYTGKPEIDWID